MKQTRAVELGTGLFVFLGVLALFFLTTQTTQTEFLGDDAYRITARFENVGGLKVGAPVSMAGVKIGRVESIEFDTVQLNAVVGLRITAQYDTLPDDSDAAIFTSGLLGGQYIGLEPGGSDTYLKDEDEVLLTQDAIVLEKLISKYLFSGRSGD